MPFNMTFEILMAISKIDLLKLANIKNKASRLTNLKTIPEKIKL